MSNPRPLNEYSLRLVVRVRRHGEVSAERKHVIVDSLRRRIEKQRTAGHFREPYVVELCEVRDVKRV